MELESLMVGTRFPDERYINKNGACRLRPHNNFTDAIICLPDLRRKEIDSLVKGPFKYGLFVFDAIPFIVLKFLDTGMYFDFSMNIYGLKEDFRQEWISQESNAFIIVPVEATTGLIRGIRLIGFDPVMASMVRMACSQQLELYRNPFEVDSKIVDIQDRFTTPAMFDRCKMTFTQVK